MKCAGVHSRRLSATVATDQNGECLKKHKWDRKHTR